MAERPNQARVRRAIESFNQGQPGGFMELLADDVIWHVPGSAPGAGTYHGKAGVAEFLAHLRQRSVFGRSARAPADCSSSARPRRC